MTIVKDHKQLETIMSHRLTEREKLLMVPIALDKHNHFVFPRQAQKGQEYHCIGCKQPLIFRAGKKNIRHFGHKYNHYCGIMADGQSGYHIFVEWALESVFDQWRVGEWSQSIPLPLPPKERVKRVEKEYLVKTPKGNIVPDICLLGDDDEPLFAIELYYKHAVDRLKVEKIKSINLPWVQLDAERMFFGLVREQRLVWIMVPFQWRSSQTNNSKTAYFSNSNTKETAVVSHKVDGNKIGDNISIRNQNKHIPLKIGQKIEFIHEINDPKKLTEFGTRYARRVIVQHGTIVFVNSRFCVLDFGLFRHSIETIQLLWLLSKSNTSASIAQIRNDIKDDCWLCFSELGFSLRQYKPVDYERFHLHPITLKKEVESVIGVIDVSHSGRGLDKESIVEALISTMYKNETKALVYTGFSVRKTTGWTLGGFVVSKMPVCDDIAKMCFEEF